MKGEGDDAKNGQGGKQRVKFCQFYAAVQHQRKLTPIEVSE